MIKGHSVFVKISLSNDTYYLVTSGGGACNNLGNTKIPGILKSFMQKDTWGSRNRLAVT